MILLAEDEVQKIEECTFEPYEVKSTLRLVQCILLIFLIYFYVCMYVCVCVLGDMCVRARACVCRPQVYAVDVAMSTGDGKPREGDARTTVYKRRVDKTYNLRIKGSRQFINEVNRRFPIFPFTLRYACVHGCVTCICIYKQNMYIFTYMY